MDVIEAIMRRRSVRKYDPRPVAEDVLARVLEAGRLAPSASNIQPWHFIVVKDQALREKLTDGRWAKFLKDSPVVIVGCGDTKASPEWHVVDTTIALTHMVLAATAEGLGTCWIGSFFEDKVKEALDIPGHMTVVAMLAVGYPADPKDLDSKKPSDFKRKKASQIISSGTYE
jgi:nitroreductase